jgi:hypothetical protein
LRVLHILLRNHAYSGNVAELFISASGLNGTLSTMIGLLSALSFLEISTSNVFGTLPSQVYISHVRCDVVVLIEHFFWCMADRIVDTIDDVES